MDNQTNQPGTRLGNLSSEETAGQRQSAAVLAVVFHKPNSSAGIFRFVDVSDNSFGNMMRREQTLYQEFLSKNSKLEKFISKVVIERGIVDHVCRSRNPIIRRKWPTNCNLSSRLHTTLKIISQYKLERTSRPTTLPRPSATLRNSTIFLSRTPDSMSSICLLQLLPCHRGWCHLGRFWTRHGSS